MGVLVSHRIHCKGYRQAQMNKDQTTSTEDDSDLSLYGLRWSGYLRTRTEEARQRFPSLYTHPQMAFIFLKVFRVYKSYCATTGPVPLVVYINGLNPTLRCVGAEHV